MNPFKYGCIVEGKNFCKRPELSRQIENYVRCGQNIVIQGERRIGKSSLVTNTLSMMKGWRFLYADFMDVRTVADVSGKLAEAMTRFQNDDSLFRRALGLISSLRPVMTVDPVSGSLSLSIDYRQAARRSSMDIMLNAIAELSKNGNICFVFDEFQDILRLKESHGLIAEMRSRIQFLSDTPFIFLGSSRNKMLDIFQSPKSPFYKSAIIFDIGSIEDDEFYAFVAAKFKEGGRRLSKEIFLKILDFTRRISGDVQEYSDAIWQITKEGRTIGEEDLEAALQNVFSREGASFAAFARRLSDIQHRVLKALSICGGSHPCSSEFLDTACLTNAATVKRSLAALVSEGLISQLGGEYKFNSPFFEEWVRRTAR